MRRRLPSDEGSDDYADDKFEEYDDDFEDEPDDDKAADEKKSAGAVMLPAPSKISEPDFKKGEKESKLQALQQSIDSENALAKERIQLQAQRQADKHADDATAQRRFYLSSDTKEEKMPSNSDPAATAPIHPRNTPAHRQRMKRLQAVKQVVTLQEEKFVGYQSRRGSRYDVYKARLNSDAGGIRQQAVGREEEREMSTQTEPTSMSDHAVQFKYGDDMEFYQRIEAIQQLQYGATVELDARSRLEQHAGQVQHDIQGKMLQVNTTTFTPFVMAAGKIMQLTLQDRDASSAERENQNPNTSNEIFDASSAWQPLGTDVTQGANMLIQGRRIRAVAFSHLQPRLLSTWHQPLDNAEEDILPHQLVGAVWDMTDTQAPLEIVAGAGNPTSASFSASQPYIVAGATDDGCLYIWDLREPRGLHVDSDTMELGVRCGIRHPTYNTNAFSLERSVHFGKIESLVSIGTTTRDQAYLWSGSSQFVALDEHGVLSFWMTSAASEKHQDDVALNIGARVRLICTKVLNVADPTNPAAPQLDHAISYHAIAVCAAQPDTFLVGGREGTILKTSRFTVPKPPTTFGQTTNDIVALPARISCIAVSPHDQRVFVTGNVHGVVALWSLTTADSRASWLLPEIVKLNNHKPSKSHWAITSIYWRAEVAGVFVVVLQNGMILEFDIFTSLNRPVLTTKAGSGSARLCDISLPAMNTIYCAISDGTKVVVRPMHSRQENASPIDRTSRGFSSLLGIV